MHDLPPTRCRLLEPGLLTTVQDLGRVGYQRFGVPVAGPMDPWALRCANRLVGNPDNAAAIEVTIVGPSLLFERAAIVAWTGGDFPVSLNGAVIPGWQAVEIPAGSTLKIGTRQTGARGYLSIAGGIAVPPILESRSTHLRSGMGGLGGHALRAGDVLAGGEATPEAKGRVGCCIAPALRPGYSHSPTLRVIRGPQVEAFRPDAMDVLSRERYTISREADRMGYRLHGAPLEHRNSPDIVSDATPLGSLQVPASRQPILLMADRQTTGGYPKIAVVISADVPLAAQLVPGDTIGFTVVEVEEAQRVIREQYRELDLMLSPVGR